MKSHNLLAIFTSASLLALSTSCTTTDPGNSPTAAAQVSAGSTKPYPLDTCVVTGNRLGSMGDPVRLVHEGQELKFCCRPCVKKFKANPDKYLTELQSHSN